MATGITIVPQSPIKTFFKVTSFTAATGVTTENVTGSVFIPANTIIDAAAVIEITARAIKTGVAGTLTVRIYANTTDVLSGAVLLGTFVGSATDIFVQLSRTLFIGKSPVGTKVFSPSATASPSDDTRVTAAEVNQAVDWADPQYIILSIQNAAAGDSSVGSGIMVKTYK
jgi:hypothetical protein